MKRTSSLLQTYVFLSRRLCLPCSSKSPNVLWPTLVAKRFSSWVVWVVSQFDITSSTLCDFNLGSGRQRAIARNDGNYGTRTQWTGVCNRRTVFDLPPTPLFFFFFYRYRSGSSNRFCIDNGIMIAQAGLLSFRMGQETPLVESTTTQRCGSVFF